jgi:hypothetical protein
VSSTFWITLLYALAAGLPTLGIILALVSLRHPVAQSKRYHKVRTKYETDKAAAEAAGDSERADQIETKYLEAINKQDPYGRRLGMYGGIHVIEDHTIVAERQYKGLRRDAWFIVIGLICGAVASVWSLHL